MVAKKDLVPPSQLLQICQNSSQHCSQQGIGLFVSVLERHKNLLHTSIHSYTYSIGEIRLVAKLSLRFHRIIVRNTAGSIILNCLVGLI